MTIRKRVLTNAEPIVTAVDRSNALSRMNVKHAVVQEGGRTVVLTEEFDPSMERNYVTRSSFADIQRFYHQRVRIEEDKWTTLGSWWLSHPQRRQYKGVIFKPGAEDVPNYFNLWRGFSTKPEPGDWSLYNEHLYEIVCDGDADLYVYMLSWMAQGVQRPDEKPEVAVVLRSDERGTGKSFFTRYYRMLFGQHGVEISNPQHLTGRFNAHLEDCCVLVITEAFWAGSRLAESVLKSLITEDTIAIERKGVDVRLAKSYVRVLMTSNSEWVVPAGLDERRFLVLDVSPERKQDTDYFSKIAEQMENGGLAAMLYDLQQWDYSIVDLRRAPQTAALTRQKIHSLDPREQWLFDKFYEGRILPDDPGWCPEVAKAALHKNFVEQVPGSKTRGTSTETKLGIFLKRVLGPALSDPRPKRGKHRVRCWMFPPLQQCRDLFDRRLGSPYEWPPADLRVLPRPVVPDLLEEILGTG